MNEREQERVLKAVANRRRAAMVRLLKKRKEMSVGAVAEVFKLSFKATSKHLNILAHAGILEKEQRSLNMFYRLSPDMPNFTRRLVTLL
jgi:DNA-binding transcriptional ArsR family regulator